MNPKTEYVGHAVMPLSAFPCQINEGETFYILKLTNDTLPVIICQNNLEDIKSNDGE